MQEASQCQERRSCSRVLLDLPLDFRALSSSGPYGGIAIDGSETGLLIHSPRDIPVGTQLSVSVLFADEYELASIKAMTKIVRKIPLNNDRKGYGYGLKFLRMTEGDLWKFYRILINQRHGLAEGSSGPPSTVNSGVSTNNRCSQPKKERKSFGAFLLSLLGIH